MPAFKLNKDCSEYISSMIFGCAGLAFGAIPSAALMVGVSATTLAGMAFAARQHHGPEDQKAVQRAVERIGNKIRKDLKSLKHQRGKELYLAERALIESLPNCVMSRKQLAADANAGSFPEAATSRVLACSPSATVRQIGQIA